MFARWKPNLMFRLGMFCLAAGEIAHWVMRRAGVNESVDDFVFGLLMGIAIAPLGVWIVKGKRRSA